MDGRKRNIMAQVMMFAAVSQLKKKKKRSVWVKKYRQQYCHMPLIEELRENYPDDFKNYLRMDDQLFNMLLDKIKHKISRQDTVMRESISAEARLAATLRYLATGRSFEDLKFSTGISAPSLSTIIPETCRAIYECLRLDYLKMPSTKEEWIKIAKEFEMKWQFINCGGAMDGKHIRIVPLPGSGAMYYNYKHFYSIVLMALVGPNYEFIYVDVGKNGRISDGGVLDQTDFYHKLKMGNLDLPENCDSVNNMNFVFLGDEAFALEPNFLKPYSQRELDYEKRIFNYRLSRARNVVENAFGIISARFRVLQTAINLKKHKNICYVVLAVCTLHNLLCKRSNTYCTSNHQRDQVNTDSQQHGELFENSVPLINLQSRPHARITLEAKRNREQYKVYFNTEGSVEWQDRMIKSGRA